MRRAIAITALGLASALTSSQDVPLPSPSPSRLLEHVRTLAAAELRGRAAGTPGEEAAAQYIARELDGAGIPPPPGAERFHAFTLAGREGEGSTSRNVVGWIEGSDAELKAQVIVLGAHFDHLGEARGQLHPGADDNASGVALVLEAARLLQTRSAPLRRSIALVFFGAEEVGLQGSRAFVRSGPVPIERVAAMVNVDMIGRRFMDQGALAALKRLLGVDDTRAVGVLGAREQPLLREAVESSCAKAGIETLGARNIPFVSQVIDRLAKNRSDDSSFAAAGVPALFFGSGESDDYHRPSDTANKIDAEILSRRVLAVYETVLALVAAPAERFPKQANALPPPGAKRTVTLELAAGGLTLLLRDNAESPRVLSGIDALFHSAQARSFDAFDPDAAGASAGLNFEHIISGHRDAANRFAPRQGKYALYALSGGRSAVLVRRREDCPWDVSSTLEYRLVEPHYVDIEFRCTPHTRSRFGERGHAVFFFANYMNDVEDAAIHFLAKSRFVCFWFSQIIRLGCGRGLWPAPEEFRKRRPDVVDR
jgi:hypothetical protein